jgi:C4-dicarboxylate transporter DctM subunit
MSLEAIFGFFFLLTLVGVPIAFAIGAVSLLYIGLTGVPLLVVGQRMVAGADSFPLLAAPLFMLAGTIMNAGGITQRLLRLSDALVGHVPGGLAQVNVFSSLLMAGMSGSATADAAGQGSTMIPAMVRSGYSRGMSAAVTSASSVIGPIFPPSVPFVIYGAVAQVSVGQLFIGAIVPGLMMTIVLMLTVYLLSRKAGYRTRASFSGSELLGALRSSALDLVLPVLIVGGLIGGVFTPVEAAAIAVMYALLLEVVIYRGIAPRDLPGLLVTAGKIAAIVMFVIAVSNAFGWILVREGAGRVVSEGLLGLTTDPQLLRILLVVLLLVLGLFIETIVLIILIVPILVSLGPHLAMDPVHLGVSVVFTIMLGLITPPVGLCMFIVNSIARISVAEYTRAILPYFGSLVVCAFAIALVPGLTTILPGLLMR